MSSQVLASSPGKAEVAPEENQPEHHGDDLKQDVAHHHDRWGRLMRIAPGDKRKNKHVENPLRLNSTWTHRKCLIRFLLFTPIYFGGIDAKLSWLQAWL